MSYIKTDNQQGIASITLNRPSKHNAFNNQMINDLQVAIKTAETTPGIRFILLSANGKHFSAGADINWMRASIKQSAAENATDAQQLADLLYQLAHCKLPVICRVQGRSFGGALGLMACCDIVIASDVATFCFSEVKIGLLPATIAPYILRKIGFSRTMQYFLSAKTFEAEQALEFNLIHQIKPAAELETDTNAICLQLLKNGPEAMMKVKALLNQLHPITHDTVATTANFLAETRTSAEGQEGLEAFLEKRHPNWLNTHA